MFSILQKGQDTVNVDDLETLQNEIEDILVATVTKKWELERDLNALNTSSPDDGSLPSTNTITYNNIAATSITTTSTSHAHNNANNNLNNNAPNLKLQRHSSRAHHHNHNNTDLAHTPHTSEASNDPLNSSNTFVGPIGGDYTSNALITEDSVGSEISLASSQSSNTIILPSHLIDTNISTNVINTSSLASNHSLKRNTNQKNIEDGRPSKRFRPNSNSSVANGTSYTKRLVNKNRSKVVPSKFQKFYEEPSINPSTSRNEAPDKLWPFVEQFCAHPNRVQIEELEAMIKSIDSDKDYFRVPPLGSGKKNTLKDSPSKLEFLKTKDSQAAITTSSAQSSKSPKGPKISHDSDSNSGLTSSTKGVGQSGTAAGAKKNSKTASCNDDSNRYVCLSDFWSLVINKLPHSFVDIFNLFRSLLTSRRHTVNEEAGLGALTQRLVSCLIEESASVKDSDDDNNNKKKNSRGEGKKVDLSNAKNLEKRIRQELEDYQILNQQDDVPFTSEEDEVLRELRACQHELALIQICNKKSMQQLAKKASKHLELIETRDKLKEANVAVIIAYAKLIQAKQRKKTPSKKEKDAAWKALKVQDEIYKQCEELHLSN